MKTLLSLALFSISACATVEETTIANNKLTLDTNNCVVTFNKTSLPLDIEPNCLLIKSSQSNDVRSKYYKDIESHVVLILGGTHHTDTRRPVTSTRKDCGVSIRAILIKGNKAIISSEKFDDFHACAGIGVDEKVYHMLSHPYKD